MSKITNFLKKTLFPIFLATPVVSQEGVSIANNIPFTTANLDKAKLDCIASGIAKGFNIDSKPPYTSNEQGYALDAKITGPYQRGELISEKPITFHIEVVFEDNVIRPSVSVTDGFYMAESVGFYIDESGNKTSELAVSSNNPEPIARKDVLADGVDFGYLGVVGVINSCIGPRTL